MLETWVQSLGWEDPLKKGMATHASILAWRIPWTVYSLGLHWGSGALIMCISGYPIPFDSKESQPVAPKGNQSWIFIGRTDPETETPIVWSPDVNNWLIGKDPDAGKDWRREEKGMAEDEMVGWHHRCDGHEFEQALGIGDGQGSLVCCNPWGCRVGHDWVTELNWKYFYSETSMKGSSPKM